MLKNVCEANCYNSSGSATNLYIIQFVRLDEQNKQAKLQEQHKQQYLHQKSVWKAFARNPEPRPSNRKLLITPYSDYKPIFYVDSILGSAVFDGNHFS